MPREQRAEEIDGPLLQRLGEQRVIGVGERRAVTFHASSQPSPCSSTSRRINSATATAGCVSLSCTAHFSWKVAGMPPSSAWMRSMSCSEQLVKKNCCLSRSTLPCCDFVVGVEHLRDCLRRHLVLDRAVVVAVVERSEVERLDGFGFPKPQRNRRCRRGSRRSACRRRRRALPSRGSSEREIGPAPSYAPRCARQTSLHTRFPAARYPMDCRVQPFVGHLDLPPWRMAWSKIPNL